MSDLRVTRKELEALIQSVDESWDGNNSNVDFSTRVADAILARFSLPEQEWEYGATRDPGSAYAEYVTGDEGTIRGYVKGRPHLYVFRRRKAGPWLPVPAPDPKEETRG